MSRCSARLCRRPAAWAILALALVGLLASACGGDDGGFDPDAAGAWAPEDLGIDDGVPVQPAVANSRLGVEPSRVAIGLFDRDGRMVADAQVSARFYRLTGEDGELAATVDLTPVVLVEEAGSHHEAAWFHDDPFAAVYTAVVDLDRAEWWGAALDVTIDGETYGPLPVRFFVSERTSEPRIGDPVPPSVNLTVDDVDDLSLLDSSPEPRAAMHEHTVRDALELGRPLVVGFVTPAFCQSRFCGPVMEQALVPLHEEFHDSVEFIHIEPFQLDVARTEGNLVPVPEMAEWGLQTEPWVFVIGADGRVVAKFEGITSAAEVRPAVLAALGPGSSS